MKAICFFIAQFISVVILILFSSWIMTICAAIADEKWDRFPEGLLFGCFVDILIVLIIYGALVV